MTSGFVNSDFFVYLLAFRKPQLPHFSEACVLLGKFSLSTPLSCAEVQLCDSLVKKKVMKLKLMSEGRREGDQLAMNALKRAVNTLS